MGAGAAGPLSLMTLGLGAAGGIAKGFGDQAAANMRAAQAERAAQFGRVQADLTDTTMRENLRSTLGNIEAVRAAGYVDPTSPTTGAILDRQEQIGDRQRTARMASIQSQIQEDEAGARYLREMGNFNLLTAFGGAGARIAGGVGRGFTTGAFGFGGGV